MSAKKYPPRPLQGLPHEEAVKRGICGAQRKNESAPCQGKRDRNGLSVCGRHCGCKNRVGHPCSQHPRRKYNGRCTNHGSESLVGPENGNWRHGGDSGWGAIFTGDSQNHYRAALEDDRYLDLRNSLAVLDTLFFEELKAAKLGQGGPLWRDLGAAAKTFREAQPTKDATTAGRALKRMMELIAEGVSRQEAQDHALRIQESHRRTSETERRRIVDQERTITQVQAMSFVAGMVALMRESVVGQPNEEEILARFNAGATRLVREYVAGGTGGDPAS